MSWINDCAVWVKEGKNGKYLSFTADRDIKAGEKLNLFKNDKKGVENRPDYRAYHNDEPKEGMSSKETKDLTEEIPF